LVRHDFRQSFDDYLIFVYIFSGIRKGGDMEFLTVRELTTSPRAAWQRLVQAGEIAITNQGKPTAIMLSVAEGDFEESLRLIRQVKAMRLLNKLRNEAAERGFLSEEEIETEIQAARVKTAGGRAG
jgi:PHD/YefM family antitoxin component YafN of YafNO toxin-antitoxin module